MASYRCVSRRPGTPVPLLATPPGKIGDLGQAWCRCFDPVRSALLLLGGDKAAIWARWCRDNIPLAEQLYIDYTEGLGTSEHELYAVGVSAEEIQAGARRLLAENRGARPAETRKQLGLAQKGHCRGVSMAWTWPHTGNFLMATDKVLGGRLDLAADFGDRDRALPVSDRAATAA